MSKWQCLSLGPWQPGGQWLGAGRKGCVGDHRKEEGAGPQRAGGSCPQEAASPAALTWTQEKGEVEIRSWKSPWAGPPGLCQQCRTSLISITEMVQGEGRGAVPQNPHGRKGAGAGGCPRGCLRALNLTFWEPHPGERHKPDPSPGSTSTAGSRRGEFPSFQGGNQGFAPRHCSGAKKSNTDGEAVRVVTPGGYSTDKPQIPGMLLAPGAAGSCSGGVQPRGAVCCCCRRTGNRHFPGPRGQAVPSQRAPVLGCLASTLGACRNKLGRNCVIFLNYFLQKKPSDSSSRR